MTVKQLLDSLSFEEIAPYIAMRSVDPKIILAFHKQHYDYLRHLAPTDPQLLEEKEALIYHYKDDKGVYLEACSLEGDLGVDCLSKELVIEEDVNESNAEIAACCLWNMSLYGFLPYHHREVFEEMIDSNTENRRESVEAYIKKFSDIIPSRSIIKGMRSFHSEIKDQMKYYRRWRISKQDKQDDFLSRRKRRWRYWKRYWTNNELQDRILYCSSFIDDLFERGNNITAIALQELGVLYRSNHVFIKRLESFAYDASKRFDYLKELIEKYGAIDRVRREMSEYAGSFICLSASSSYPVTEMEKSLLNLLTERFSGTHRLCIKTDDSCDEELRIDIAYYDL